jgi:hypothetical protein
MESINNATPNNTNAKANNERKLVKFSSSIPTSSKTHAHTSEGYTPSLFLNYEKKTAKSSSLLKKRRFIRQVFKCRLK